DRVRFEEEALELADQVYRVARRMVSSREEAEDLMQETYARAFRSWRSFQPGTNLRAWLLRILTNLNIDRGRRVQRAPDTQPLEEGDYFLYNKLEERSEEHTSELQSLAYLVCRLLLEKKKLQSKPRTSTCAAYCPRAAARRRSPPSMRVPGRLPSRCPPPRRSPIRAPAACSRSTSTCL